MGTAAGSPGSCGHQMQHCRRSLRRTRHHCRLCGGIFCAPCSARRMLLPPKFQEGTPQRVCTNCAALLLPLQPFLAGARSQLCISDRQAHLPGYVGSAGVPAWASGHRRWHESKPAKKCHDNDAPLCRLRYPDSMLPCLRYTSYRSCKRIEICAPASTVSVASLKRPCLPLRTHAGTRAHLELRTCRHGQQSGAARHP